MDLDYLVPPVSGKLPWFKVPVVGATEENLKGYGTLVSDYQNFPIEIVTWPPQGWRPVDAGTGNEGGTTAGTFRFWWEGDLLYGKNEAVDSQYLLGWCKNPEEAKPQGQDEPPAQVLLWHANYHPDGGQLFFPLDGKPFIAPLARPGDDVKPEDFVAFYVEGGQGLYIHPNIWHEAVFPLAPQGNFYDKQGKVHARVSCNIAEEFGVFLSIPLQPPKS